MGQVIDLIFEALLACSSQVQDANWLEVGNFSIFFQPKNCIWAQEIAVSLELFNARLQVKMGQQDLICL